MTDSRMSTTFTIDDGTREVKATHGPGALSLSIAQREAGGGPDENGNRKMLGFEYYMLEPEQALALGKFLTAYGSRTSPLD